MDSELDLQVKPPESLHYVSYCLPIPIHKSHHHPILILRSLKKFEVVFGRFVDFVKYFAMSANSICHFLVPLQLVSGSLSSLETETDQIEVLLVWRDLLPLCLVYALDLVVVKEIEHSLLQECLTLQVVPCQLHSQFIKPCYYDSVDSPSREVNFPKVPEQIGPLRPFMSIMLRLINVCGTAGRPSAATTLKLVQWLDT
ncbi:hypothetical protein Tco_1051248 [Tanacetum coccineum]